MLSSYSLSIAYASVRSTTAAKHDAVSKFVDEQFDIAYNDTLIAEDLPHVQWGRIDYLNVTYLTTKWNVWRCAGPFNHIFSLLIFTPVAHGLSSPRSAEKFCASTVPASYTCAMED